MNRIVTEIEASAYWAEREKIAKVLPAFRAKPRRAGIEPPRSKVDYWKRKHGSTSALVNKSDDADGSPTDAQKEPEDLDKKHCIECGATVNVDDRHCRKCGAKQVVPLRLPRRPREEEEKVKKTVGETGGEAAAREAEEKSDAPADREKLSFIVRKPTEGIAGMILKRLPKRHHKKALTGLGAASVVGGTLAANEISKATKQQDQPAHPGMVRTAAARRGLNPVYRIRNGKRKKRIMDALVRHRE